MKKILDSLEFKLYKARWIVFAALLFFCALFHTLIEQWLTKKLVNPYLSQIHERPLVDLLFISLALIIILIFINRLIRNYLVAGFNLSIYLIISITYTYYRNYSGVWIFERFTLFPFYYADVIALPFILGLILGIRNIEYVSMTLRWLKAQMTVKTQGKHITPYILDEPLTPDGEDELKRRGHAKDLAVKILFTKSDRAIAIGINGDWGSGKTSFFQMMKDEMKRFNNVVIIDFNPWRGYKENALYQDFFSALSESVGRHSDLLKVDLKRYGETLTSAKESLLDSVVTFGTNLFNINSVEGQHSEINAVLKKLDKSFVIFVDDLDRLSSIEIADIIKLVRNTADFYNLKFILAYDRNYLTSALRQLNDYNYESYLEKVILHEYTLLPISETDIKKTLNTIVQKYCIDDVKDDYQKITNVGNFDKGSHLFNFIFNLREVKRFSNRIIPLYNDRFREVEIVDFVNFELLRFRYPGIVKLHANRQYDYFRTSDEGLLTLQTLTDNKDEYVLIKYLDNNLKYFNIESANKESVFKLLIGLFVADRFFDSFLSHKSIKRTNNFDAYFREFEGEEQISNEHFEEMLKLPFDLIKREIISIIKAKKRRALIQKFVKLKVLQCNSSEEFEKTIRTIFFAGNIEAIEGESFAGYPDKDIYEKLYDTKAIVNRFYDGKTKLFKDFMFDVFQKSEYPFFNESGFLSYLSDNSFAKDFIISQQEIEYFLVKYFKDFCDRNNTFDRTFWQLYHNCVKRIQVSENTWQRVPMEEAKPIHRQFAFKNEKILKTYLQNIIEKDIRDQGVFAISQTIIAVFGSFEALVENLQQSPYISLAFVNEFITFYGVFKGGNYKSYVPFHFEHLFRDT